MFFISSMARAEVITYDRKRPAKRKDEPADAYHRDVGCQEGDGCEEVKERGVRSEALQANNGQVQSPAPRRRAADVCLIRLLQANDSRCISRPSRDSGDLDAIFHSCAERNVCEHGKSTNRQRRQRDDAPILSTQRPHWEQWCVRSGFGLQQM